MSAPSGSGSGNGDKIIPTSGPEPQENAAANAVISPTELKEAEEYLSKDNFLRLHKPQFTEMELPANLWPIVYGKLVAEAFDALESFQIEYVEDEGYQVTVKKEGGLKAGQDVWLLDHAWTTTLDQGPKQLREIDGLLDRLWEICDIDRRLQQGEAEAKHARKLMGTAAPRQQQAPSTDNAAVSTAASEADAASAASDVSIDEDHLRAIMSEAHVPRERAIEAYKATKGDLVQAILWCAGESEEEKELNARMEAMLEQQQRQQQQEAAQPSDESAPAGPVDPASLTFDQKVELLWAALFRHHLIGSYFTTVAKDVSAKQLKAEDVQTSLYVNEEVGTAIGQTRELANTNARLSSLVVVTLGGVAFSLLWLTQDVGEEEEVVIPMRPTVRIPGVPKV